MPNETLQIQLKDFREAEREGKPTALSCVVLRAFLETLPCDNEGWFQASVSLIEKKTGIPQVKQSKLLRQMRSSGQIEAKMVFPMIRTLRFRRSRKTTR